MNCNHDIQHSDPVKGILLCSKCKVKTGTYKKMKTDSGEEYYQLNFNALITSSEPFKAIIDGDQNSYWDVDCQNGDYGRLYDADGKYIEYTRRAKLKTGEAIITVEKDGKIVMENNEVKELLRTYKAPLRFERFK